MVKPENKTWFRVRRKKLSPQEKREYEREKKRKQREKIKADPEAYIRLKLRHAERRRKYKLQGKIKSVADMTPKEKKKMREKWRESKRRRRDKNKPISPDSSTPSTSSNYASSPKTVDRKAIRRDSQTLIRLKSVELKLKQARALTEKWKKRCYTGKFNANKKSPSPTKKVQNTLKKGKKEIKGKSPFGGLLLTQLKRKVMSSKSSKDKQSFCKSTPGTSLQKYRCLKQAKEIVHHRTKTKYCESISLKYYRKKKFSAVQEEIKAKIQEFFLNEENSFCLPGKKDATTKGKLRKQKRYLRGNLKILYAKFRQTSNEHISYSTFYRHKPFWVLQPKVNGQDTCLCQKHENFKFLVEKLSKLDILKVPANVNQICSSLSCDAKNKDCMYKLCVRCKENSIIVDTVSQEDLEKTITYFQWDKTTVTKNNKTTKLLVKNKISSTIGELINVMKNQTPTFLKHYYDMNHQIVTLTELKNNLMKNEIVIVVDFLENCMCKYSSEVQGAHFGGANPQITFHTGVYHTYSPDSTKNKIAQFASVSQNLRHDAPAIWAHLLPILKKIKENYPEITVFHFQSDGSTSQYRNRFNFFLFIHFAQKFKMSEATWNFTECGHGKSLADGVGRELKSTADKFVPCGTDILGADALLNVLKTTNVNIEMFSVSDSDIEEVENIIPKTLITKVRNVKPIPNISTLNQFVWEQGKPNSLQLRTLTCIKCGANKICSHFTANTSMQQAEDDVHHDQDAISAHITDDPVLSAQTKMCRVGDWVAVIYDNSWFPGLVEEKVETNVKLTFMHKAGDKYFWPTKKDTQILPLEEILCIIDKAPYPISRKHFAIEDTFKYDKIMSTYLLHS